MKNKHNDVNSASEDETMHDELRMSPTGLTLMEGLDGEMLASELANASRLLNEASFAFTSLVKSFGGLGAGLSNQMMSGAGETTGLDTGHSGIGGLKGGSPFARRRGNEDDVRNIQVNVLDMINDIDAAFKKLGASVLQNLLEPLNEVASELASSLFKKVFGTLFPTIWGGGLAGGGRIQPGVPTLVGERGPELMVADRPATVMNAADTRGAGAGGVSIQQTLHFDLVPAPTIGAMIENAMPAIVAASKAAVLTSLRRGA